MSETGRRRQMREQGYRDGYNGRPARWRDAEYQTAWRRGREVRASDSGSQDTPDRTHPWR